MNNREAQFVLSAYRPDGQDATDPQFAEALEQARRDPALGEWLEREQRCDRLIAERLAGVMPPWELRHAILAGGRISRRPAAWAKPWVWALAACAVLLLGAGMLWQRQVPNSRHSTLNSQPPLALWQREALNFLENGPRLDHEAKDPRQLVSWLEAKDAVAPAAMPPGLGDLLAAGCKILDVRGRQVSVLCFHRPDGGLVHLVVTKRAPGETVIGDEPAWQQTGRWTTASWSSAGQDYMLTTDGPREDLSALL